MRQTNPESQSCPLVSCIMPTYNRIKESPSGPDATLLEEAIHSFMSQDYPNKELIIINDTPGQVIHLPSSGYENVTVINLQQRLPTLGHKYRKAIELARGRYITPWDDDDIMLPTRLRRCHQHVAGADALIVRGLYCIRPDGQVTFDANSGFAADWYDRSLIQRVGYHLSSFGSDLETRTSIVRNADKVSRINPNINWHFYIYRWATTGHPHLSGLGKDGYDKLGKRPIYECEVELKPRWQQDYVTLIENFRHAQINRLSDQ